MPLPHTRGRPGDSTVPRRCVGPTWCILTTTAQKRAVNTAGQAAMVEPATRLLGDALMGRRWNPCRAVEPRVGHVLEPALIAVVT